jgi:hypothetical protein
MKKVCYFTAVLFGSFYCSFGTVRTLCNMPYSPGQYTDFFNAQAFSAPGDTIYVHGSNINYGDIFVDRPLVIIGTGHNPNKQSPLVASFLNINIISDNVQLIGLTFNFLGSFRRNCQVKKCRVLGTPADNSMSLGDPINWLIEGNIFEQTTNFCIHFNFRNAPNTIIQNNIFATSYSKIAGINNSAIERTYILNNVFLCDNTFYTFFNLNYVTVNNNIFYGSSPYGSPPLLANSSMNNNISYQCFDNTFFPGLNNLENVDPQFVNYPGPPALFNYNYDFSLNPTSPGHNTATDGTDRGVWGGIGFLFSMTGEPSIAEITAFTITSPTIVPPGGTLNISITSKRAH